MIAGEEWKEESEKTQLVLPMAKRYAEAGTVFLFETERMGGNILSAQIKRVSPSGDYVYLGPEGASEGAWLPLSSVRILDVLVPMQEKELGASPAEALKVMAAIEMLKAMSEPQPPKPKKGKNKQ